MRKNIFISFLLLSATTLFAQINIEVTNQLPYDRVDEIVEVKASEIGALAPNRYVLYNAENVEVPYQLIYNGTKAVQSLIFPATVKTGTKEVYTLKAGKPSPVVAKTFARFVPERKDDFAWENNLAAYRMYGPALAKDNPSNGVDLWLKRTEELVVDSFYRGELKYGKSYHVDHGQGLDCYKVGQSLGAGGIAPYTDSTLWIGRNFNKYEVIENGPLRSVFRLSYDSVKIKGKLYKQQITITTEYNGVLNKAVVRYTGPAQPMQLATGIFLHDGKGSLQKGSGMIVYGEDAVSDAGLDMGKNFVGVLLPAKETAYKVENLHALLLTDYVAGKDFTYYFGGGWSQWKFPSQKEWLKAVQDYSRSVKFPFAVKVVKPGATPAKPTR
jgi:hypothetical protein